jgi:hypothetical protein
MQSRRRLKGGGNATMYILTSPTTPRVWEGAQTRRRGPHRPPHTGTLLREDEGGNGDNEEAEPGGMWGPCGLLQAKMGERGTPSLTLSGPLLVDCTRFSLGYRALGPLGSGNPPTVVRLPCRRCCGRCYGARQWCRQWEVQAVVAVQVAAEVAIEGAPLTMRSRGVS